MEKDQWIQEKVKILIQEGKDPDQAAAIANSMWEDMQKKGAAGPGDHVPGDQNMAAGLDPLPSIPFFPAYVGAQTIDGRKVSKDWIQGIESYDPGRRRAYVKLNPVSGHGDLEPENTAALAVITKITKTDWNGKPYYQAEVEATVPEYHQVLKDFLAGKYPERSAELIRQADGSYYLKGIALLGGDPPAFDLPPVGAQAAVAAGASCILLTFSTEKKTMSDEVKTPSAGQEDVQAQVEKFQAQLKERDVIIEGFRAEFSKIQGERAQEKVQAFMAQDSIRVRVNQEERPKLEAALIHLAMNPVKFTLGEAELDLGEVLKESLAARKELVSTKPVDVKSFDADLGDYQGKRRELAEKVLKEKQDAGQKFTFGQAMVAVRATNPELFPDYPTE